MKVAGRFLYHPIQQPIQRLWHCIARFAWVGLTIIALVVSEFLPITSASLHHKADASTGVASEPMPTRATASAERFAGDTIARLPLRFEACDKTAPERFLAQTNESTVYLSATEATLSLPATAGAGRLGCGADLGIPRNARSPQANEQLPGPRRDRAAPRPHAAATLRIQFIGANRRARVAGEEQLPTLTNYFIGKDASRWRTNVTNYGRVKVEQVYRGVDVVYYGSGQQLEYDFKVAPRADYKAIRLRFDGARSVRLDEIGDLLIETPAGTLRHRKPVAYQEVNGARRGIVARYVINRLRDVGLAVGDYDKRLPLVIDPLLSYATYFGSVSGGEFINAIAFDLMGNAYIVGSTNAPDLPTTPGALQPVSSSARAYEDVFIAKLNSAGTAVLYATYLGGSNGDDGGSIAVDAKGNAYVTGRTSSTDFPTTANAFQRDPLGISSHPFVAKLNATGTALVYSTYLGSPKEIATGIGIAVDAVGQATVAGNTDSPRFPTTPGAVQATTGGGYDAFVARLNVDGSALVYATYLGGSSYDAPQAIAIDAEGNTYLGGGTNSVDFPTTRRAYLRSHNGFAMGFIAKINATGNKLAYSTFLNAGGVKSIAVDAQGNVYATGSATTSDLVTTPGVLQPFSAGGIDAFVTKLNETGSALVYSTFIGGNGTDAGYAIAVDSLGNSYVTGTTTSTDFPLVNPLQSRKRGGPLFKSTDGGSNWEDIPASADTPTSLILDPQTPSTLYALAPRDVLKSTNGGATWRVIAPRVTDSLVIDPMRPTILYGFSGRSVYKSTDSGANWQRTDFPANIPGYLSTLVIDPKMPDTLYLSAQQRPAPGGSGVQLFDAPIGVIFKSTDGGTSWSTLDFGLPEYIVACLTIDPEITSTIYAGTDTHGLLKSTDGGTSWFRASGIFISRLVVDPTNSAILYGIVFNNLWKSTNGGASWIQTPLQQSVITSLAIDPHTPSTLYAGNFRGLHQTIDGGASWRTLLNDVFITEIVLDQKQPSTIYTTTSVTNDLFIVKLNTTGTALVYSTYLGGLGEDVGSSISVDAYGNAYVAGYSISPDFPVTPNAYQTHGAKTYTGMVIRIADPAPLRITDVSIKGKKLFVSGEGFDQGAVITVNNVDLETQNDAATPSVLLISKKGGKQIAPGQTVTIRVRDADGKLSEGFSFTRGAD